MGLLLPRRVLDRLVPDGDCLLYDGPLVAGGYAQIWWEGRNAYLHRVVYHLAHDDFPVRRPRHGDTLDHDCRRRHCAALPHLEPVPHVVNVRRALPHRDRRSTFIGVAPGHHTRSWAAYAKRGGRWMGLGHHPTELAAAAAYDDWSQVAFGDRPNGTTQGGG